jgi:putative ABC transport system permease protein
MKMAARELLRRPRSFLVPVAILGLLALLLLYPSSILDGIVFETTSAMRNAPADLIVYSKSANGLQARSKIEQGLRKQVEGVPGVARTAAYDVIVQTGLAEGRSDPLALAVTASDQPVGDRVPGPGEAIADVSLRDRFGVTEGAKIQIGPSKVPVTVVGFTRGSNLFFANGFIVHKVVWLAMLAPMPPGFDLAAAAPVALQQPSQALLVTVAGGQAPTQVGSAIDAATGGQTQSMTREVAVKTMPGIEQQEGIFAYMRFITLMVALVVVALFLSFMTLERAPLYAALKAIGASSRQLFLAVVLQVLLITALAVTAATVLTFSLTRLPSAVPTVMAANRVIDTWVALAFTAVVGAGISLRRVVNVDPADAIG